MNKFSTILAEISSPALEELVRYWQQLDPAPVIPHRQQFNPVDIPQCLRHIILMDVGTESPKYFIRLAGSSVNPVYHKSITGYYLEELLCEADAPPILAQYDYTVANQEPTFMAGDVQAPDGKRLNYERVILPMTTNGKTADKLLVGINFFNVKQYLIDRPTFKL